ncbi:ribosome-associated translation inhibitor RaiA [Frankia sp. CNm7]|uniref:Ribosome hibernation promoting factor n=1 Tax=Frankia nepalensis TaxID=1836974 RepID=A0A937RHY2_9ACTN|nr:ribosome-associated translation inhibitor RaiA [Frankia nepalensis]MBL7496864.1 ribosome-associated translation inhibitor RaiA [Frankia nepalensis]MBL7512064.1 ribosome-associated translation inhibitor RaiA [Frankia nepalensis]MBL7519664.1 ribosome-associated translation inhibitor RaiA [Frankia nepalensis]MBL7630477.1 ribosome-associated translation inhibitor RaiA [Frankia nepalensis]
MEIVVKGRHTAVPDRFRSHVQTKLAKLERYDGKVIRVDVELSHEHNRRMADVRERVELTVYSRGPVIRAEAAAADPYSALDVATSKLAERLRRAAERRADHKHGNNGQGHGRAYVGPPPPARAGAATPGAGGRAAPPAAALATEGLKTGGSPHLLTPADVAAAARRRPVGDDQRPGAAGNEATEEPGPSDLDVDRYEQPDRSPMVVRTKTHRAAPMTLDDALSNMELVGHDFYLFQDTESGHPSVVYRRRGYDYGVICLVSPDEPEPAVEAEPGRVGATP